MANKTKRIFKRILQYTVIIAITFLIVSAGATKVIYDLCFPRYESTENIIDEELVKLNEERTKTSFYSGENLLAGYLYSPADETKDNLVIFVLGINAAVNDYLWQIKSFTDNGYGVFIFDPTGCGESEGKSAVGFSQILIDLNAALDFAEKEENFGFERIFLFGHSRGGYAACCALHFDHDITAVASVNGINSAMEGIMMPAAKAIGDIAYTNYPLLWLYQVSLFGTETVNISAVRSLEESKVPALIIHSTEDEVVPADRFSIISHVENTEYITEIHDFDTSNKDSHTGILFDKDGKANKELFETVIHFFEKAAKAAENGE
ncbi:MAG: alpha/beta fold hydrolase [Clostridia bacterium]|nr:alpha/beta fold hydrolase [Clostridia bacterium]